MNRKRLWILSAAAAVLAALPPVAARAAADLRVYVVVVDGLDPAEVGPEVPTLWELRTEGIWYENARAVMIAETLPNHVAMMTGVLPRKNGIVANDYRNGRMQDPALVEAPTLVTRLETGCGENVSTATILSKTYLFNVFRAGGIQEQADFHWQPFPVIPVSDHAPDAATMDAFLEWLGTDPPTPQFAFVNLGDVDRSGHADPSGNAGLPAFRRASLEHTDLELRRLVDALRGSGAWGSTILFVVSDHGMDWSLPQRFVDVPAALRRAGFVPGEFRVVHNGGADMVDVADPANVPAMASVIAGLEGVGAVVTDSSSPSLADLGLDHPNAGQIVVFAKRGYRMGELSAPATAIPGNHGHAPTQTSVLLVAGGHPSLSAPKEVPGPGLASADVPQPPQETFGNLNVAPTVAALFGLSASDYDVPPLGDAFAGGTVPALFACGG